ncbi:MAG: Methionyl-tRNA formyltransferase [Parcubacteria group bacterium GW2011_GWF2_38_76]|nr:MAG: Methionyl-tRNA formyltransferase [Parcubacteria group bacterium GW2011_GWF2_38_76]HBM45662.1 methionyl-tRNA formyltransferase [Patescibacteria group bacterium]
MNTKPKFVFFGTPHFAVIILDQLEACGFLPDKIVTSPDKPKGRHLVLTPPPVKEWAVKRGIEVFQPKSLKDFEIDGDYEIFILAAYGKLVPKRILNIPKYGILNVHPSLLPHLRGPSPIQSAILEGAKETGVSIMLLDEEMDHGPILKTEKINSENLSYSELEEKLGEVGGKILCESIPSYINGEIEPKQQDHGAATYCKKIDKKDGFIESEIITSDNVSREKIIEAERKVRALNPDPGTFTILNIRDKEMRVKITKAKIENDRFIPEKVTPEGKKEMGWEDFLRGNKIPLQ